MLDPGFVDLLAAVEREALREGCAVPRGADPALVRAEFEKLGVAVPQRLLDWLTLCNGAMVGPGGIFGVATESPYLNMTEVLALFPEWVERGWIPIAGDGCGSYFVLLSAPDDNVVAFIDHEDISKPAYLVASELEQFFLALLDAEATPGSTWPFDRDEVISGSPDLESIGTRLGLPVPWTADE